jgi:hypothetical protein
MIVGTKESFFFWGGGGERERERYTFVFPDASLRKIKTSYFAMWRQQWHVNSRSCVTFWFEFRSSCGGLNYFCHLLWRQVQPRLRLSSTALMNFSRYQLQYVLDGSSVHALRTTHKTPILILNKAEKPRAHRLIYSCIWLSSYILQHKILPPTTSSSSGGSTFATKWCVVNWLRQHGFK